MDDEKAIDILLAALVDPDYVCGSDLAEAIKISVRALNEKIEKEKGGL